MKIKCIEISGVKNLTKPVKLQFLNKTNSKINEDESAIKLLYGANGSGKTAIVEAMKLYRSLVTTDSTLKDSKELDNIARIYNKQSDGIRINVEYYRDKRSFNHIIELKSVDENKYRITYEELTKMAVNGKGKALFKYENSECNTDNLYKNKEERENKEIDKVLINRTGEMSITQILFNNFILQEFAQNKVNLIESYNIFELFLIKLLWEDNTIIVSEQKDEYYQGLHKTLDTSIKTLEREIKNNQLHQLNEKYVYNSNSFVGLNEIHFSADTDFINSKNIKQYKKSIDDLTKYLRIFKPSLKEIELKEVMDGTKIQIEKILVYEYGKVSIENESVGIKKAVELFNVFMNTQNGLVIIDEFDTHFHDYLLTKLLEYIRDYTNIQLIATTHNALNMDAVKKLEHSISILSLDEEVVDWKKSGNYSPSALYSNNTLKGINFGYDELDFLEVFESRGEDEYNE